MGRVILSGSLCLLLALPVAAQGPSAREVQDLLKKEPISLKSWPAWSKRLAEWGKSDNPATAPALDAASKFLLGSASNAGALPRAFDNDATAYLLLGDAFLHEARADANKYYRFEDAEKALRKSLGFAPDSARGQFLLADAIIWQELSPKKPAGRPINVDRLKDARAKLGRARELDPSIKTLGARDEGIVALRVGDFADAERLLDQALKEKPEADVARLLAKAIALNPDHPKPRAAATGPLAEQFKDDGTVAAWHGYALALDGDRAGSEKEYQRAKGLNVDPSTIVPALDPTGTATPEPGKPAGKAAVGWLWLILYCVIAFVVFYGVVIVLMALAGFLLGVYTRGPGALNLLDAPPTELVAQGKVIRTAHEGWLTRCYGIALLLCLVLFYFAIPFLVLGLLAITGLLLLFTLFSRMGGDDRNKEFSDELLRASGGGLLAVLKSSVAGFGEGSFGLKRTAKECPRLFLALNDVAERVDTEPVDEVWLAPGSGISVHQEGRGPFGMLGSRRRVLTLGVATLHFLTVTELKSILAHEYAHFSHGDTFFNRFIAQVNLSLRKARKGFAETGGWVTWVNPFYWFFYLYSLAYALLSSGFSRSREFLADRMACSLYGADVFINALNKVVTDGSLFEMTVYHNIVDRLKRGKAFVNMYEAFRGYRNKQLDEKERAELYEKFVGEEPSLFSTHPTFGERVEAVQGLPRAKQFDKASALSLFEDPVAVERQLTDFLTENMQKRIL